VLVLAGCGGTKNKTASQHWTPQQVIQHVRDHVQVSLSFDANREDATVSVLHDTASTYGYFSIWVFKTGSSADTFTIGGVSVPANGQTEWGPWQALDRKNLPGQGTYDVLTTHGNVVLDFLVEGRKGKRPSLPGGFRLLADALSTLPS
jgi:hypothetical protein